MCIRDSTYTLLTEYPGDVDRVSPPSGNPRCEQFLSTWNGCLQEKATGLMTHSPDKYYQEISSLGLPQWNDDHGAMRNEFCHVITFRATIQYQVIPILDR